MATQKELVARAVVTATADLTRQLSDEREKQKKLEQENSLLLTNIEHLKSIQVEQKNSINELKNHLEDAKSSNEISKNQTKDIYVQTEKQGLLSIDVSKAITHDSGSKIAKKLRTNSPLNQVLPSNLSNEDYLPSPVAYVSENCGRNDVTDQHVEVQNGTSEFCSPVSIDLHQIDTKTISTEVWPDHHNHSPKVPVSPISVSPPSNLDSKEAENFLMPHEEHCTPTNLNLDSTTETNLNLVFTAPISNRTSPPFRITVDTDGESKESEEFEEAEEDKKEQVGGAVRCIHSEHSNLHEERHLKSNHKKKITHKDGNMGQIVETDNMTVLHGELEDWLESVKLGKFYHELQQLGIECKDDLMDLQQVCYCSLAYNDACDIFGSFTTPKFVNIM